MEIGDVSAVQQRILVQIVMLQHLLHIQNACFYQVCTHVPEKDHLRVLGMLVEPAGDCYRGRDRDRAAQLVLAGPAHLACGNEIRAIKIFSPTAVTRGSRSSFP